jgi:hypothetical protein
MITETNTFKNLNSIQKAIYSKKDMVAKINHAMNLIRIGKSNAVALSGIALNIAVEMAGKN